MDVATDQSKDKKHEDAANADEQTRLVKALAAMGQQRRYAARALLIQEGDLGDNIFVVKRGVLDGVEKVDTGMLEGWSPTTLIEQCLPAMKANYTDVGATTSVFPYDPV